MIQGIVNRDLDPKVSLTVHGPSGSSTRLVAVIDTGYRGHLALPSSVVSALRLPTLASRWVRLADLTMRLAPAHVAEIEWDGLRRMLRVIVLDGDPLVGTSLLKGYTMTATFEVGGEVKLEPIP